MKKIQNFQADSMLNAVKHRGRLWRAISLLSAFVMLFTMNSLKFSADTLERIPMCGYEYDHVHGPECFDENGLLTCALHEHTDACYQERPVHVEATEVEAPVEEVEAELGGEAAPAPEEQPSEQSAVEEAPADEAPAENAFDLNGLSTVKLGEIIEAAKLPVSLADIEQVGMVDDAQREWVGITFADGDFDIAVQRDFDEAELGIVVGNEVYTVMLTNGAAATAEQQLADVWTIPGPEGAEAVTEAEEEAEAAIEAEDEATTEAEVKTEAEGDAEAEAATALEGDAETEGEPETEENGEVVAEGEQQLAEVWTTPMPEEGEAVDDIGAEAVTDAENNAEEVTDTESNTEVENVTDAENDAEEVIDPENNAETENVTEENAEAVTEDEQPAETEEIVETEQPAETEEIVETEQPAETEENVEIEQPAEAEEVVETEQPAEAEEVAETEQPAEAEEVAETEQPAEAEEVAEDEQPVETEEPVEAEEPAPVEFHAGERENRINDCTVLLSWGAEAEIPDDVQVEIREIELGSDEYEALYAEALERLPEADADSTQVMRFFDITLYTDYNNRKEKVEPKAAVSVEVRVDEVVESDVTAIHYGEEETTLVDATAEGQTVTFEADSFSIYGVAYSKDAEQRSMSTRVQVDLTTVDQMDAATVTGDTVTLSLSELLAGADADVTVRGELGVDGETFVADAEVTTASAVTVEDGAITLDAEALARGSVTLEMKTREVDEEHTTTVVTHTATIELADYPGRTDEVSGEGVTVAPVNSEQTTLPGNTTASAEAVAVPEGIIDEAENAVVDAVTFDITLTDGKGEAIPEPGLMEVTVSPTNVNIYEKLPEGAVPGQVSYTLFHSHEGQEPVELPIDPEDVIVDAEGNITEFKFQTSSFSEFTLKYTVDFHWEVDGLEFVYSIEGGSAIALSELVKILGIVEEDSVPEFIASIEDVTFSTPELLWVGKAGEDTTVGAIKAANDLQIEYSDALSEEQIAAIDAMAIGAQDWALISLRAFDTQETLTVTMKNGEQFVIRTTDARKPKLTNTYSGLTIVKKWYKSDGVTEITGAELTDDYKCDITLQGWEYDPADLIRLHFIDSNGVEDPSKTVIVPAGKLQLTLYNSPVNGYGGTAYLFSEAPSSSNPINNPLQNINLLTDSAITVKKDVKLDDSTTINCWVINLDLSDYVNELTDVYLGIRPDPDTGGIEYFKSGTYPDIAAHIDNTNHAMRIAYTDIGRWQNDTYRNRHIWDTIKGQTNTYVWHNNEMELTSAGGKFFGYTLYESNASTPDGTGFTTTISWNNGADEIFTNGLTGWSADLYINSPNLENNVITIKNTLRSDVDVPVEKHWPWMDEYVANGTYDWEARFVLQWAPVYEGETVPSVDFVEVEPRQYITITSTQMEQYGSSFDERKFYNLPLSGEDEKGPFRYQYSVEEESYTVRNHQSGAVVATYDRYGEEGHKYTGGLPEFIPYYPHDAGELSANPSDYMIMVTNALSPNASDPTINITVNKDWDDEAIMEDDTHDYHATVKIQRYDQVSTRRFSEDYDAANPEMVTIDVKENGQTVKTLTATKGVAQRIHISLTSPGYGSANFACSSDNPNVSFFNIINYSLQPSYPGGTAVYPNLDFDSDEFYPVDDMVINITANSANGGVAVNLQENFSIEDQAFSDPAPDTAYNNDPNNTFTLSLLENRWSRIITDLPLTKTVQNGDTVTIHHYSYYFVEDEANTTPSGYTPSYVRYDTVGTGREFEIGDRPHRINYDGEHVTIQNTKNKFRVKKEWRGIQRSEWYMYPAVKFDLYRTTNPQQQGERIMTGIELSEANGWEWSTEDLEAGYYYYVVEDMSFDTDNMYQVWEYYNSNGQASLPDQPYYHAIDKNGTITILNSLRPDDKYIQTYMQKKWMEWETPYSWATTTSVYKRLHDLVMGFIVDRRAWELPQGQNIDNNLQYPDARIISGGTKGWEPFGYEMLAGYDSNGNPVLDKGGNNFTVYYSGTWHWTILQGNNHNDYNKLEIGLPSEGWYEKADGTKVWAKFEYIIRETGIWKDLKKNPVEDPEISWFSNVVPINAKSGNGEHKINEFDRDIGQDPLRIMNGAGYDLWVEKNWVGGNFDAREVYVKIYRRLQDGSKFEDFTEELARDAGNNGLIGYLSGKYANMIDKDNKWIVFTPSNSRLYIDKVLKTHPNASGTNLYEYWLQEVGYKDKHGQVHMFIGNGANQSDVNVDDLMKLEPTYTGVALNNGNNIGITLQGKGQNALGITNTPVRDFAVIKKWKNSLGDDIEAPVDELKISIMQTRTRETDGLSVSQPVTFNGNNQLTITKENSSNSIVLTAQGHPGGIGSQNYTYSSYKTNQNYGPWALYISGLEEDYQDEDGNLWTCTYKISEDSTGIPASFVTEVSYDGLIDRDNRNITISNVKMDGGMLKVVKQIADGSDYETEEPFTLTVTLTPPLKPGPAGENGEREKAFHLDPGKQIANYIEIDEEETILIEEPVVTEGDDNVVTITMTLAGRGSFTIKDITPDTTYEVYETLGATSSWQQDGEVDYSNSKKTIVKQRLDTATVTNEEPKINVPVTKLWVDDEGHPGVTDWWPEGVTVHVNLLKQVGNGDKEEAAECTLDSEHRSHTFEGMPEIEGANTIAYTVEEVEVFKGEGTPEDFDPKEFASAITKNNVTNGFTITNTKGSKGSVKVKKTFAGITASQIPEGFQIAASWDDGAKSVTLTTTGYTDTLPEGVSVTVDKTGSGLEYTWTIGGLEKDTVVSFVESGYDVSGYSVTINGEATATALTATATMDPTAVTFTNTYTRDTGSLNIKKIGKVNGADPTAANHGLIDGEYTFTITGDDTATTGNSATVKITITNGVVTDAEKVGSSTPTDVTVSVTGSGENAVALIGNLPTGTYTVSETLTAEQTQAGISLLSSNGNTNVGVTANNSAAIPTATFTNNKDVVNLKLKKTVQGTNAPDDNFTFTVTLTAPTGVTFDASYPTVKTPNGGTAETGTASPANAITVTLKGGDTWQINNLPKGTEYNITEGDLPIGWTLMTTSPQTGTIDTAGETEEVEFTNKYSEVTKAPQATKALTGRNWKDGDEFTFTIAADAGYTATAVTTGKIVMPDPATATATKSVQTATFGNITFKEPGTYYFTIKETPGSETGITYSQKEVKVKVEVTKDAGVLFATMTYAETKSDNNVVTTGELTYAETVQKFTNTYDTSTTTHVEGTKAYNGSTGEMAQFSFTISAETGTPLPNPATVNAGTNGAIVFGDMTYTMAMAKTGSVKSGAEANGDRVWEKTYTYEVNEVIPGSAVTDAETNAGYAIRNGVKYDLSEKDVTVTVTYDENTGVLTATPNPATLATNFANEKLGALKITKVVTVDGSSVIDTTQKLDWTNGDYTFTVVGPTGAELADQVRKYVRITVKNGVADSYRIADTEEGLDSAEKHNSAWAVIPDLSQGDYTVTETNTNGLTLTGVVRGDNNTEVVSQDKAVTLHVTAGENNPGDNSSAAATFTNNKVTGKLYIKKTLQMNSSETNHEWATGDFTFKLERVTDTNTGTGGDTPTFEKYITISIVDGEMKVASWSAEQNGDPITMEEGYFTVEDGALLTGLELGTYKLTEVENTVSSAVLSNYGYALRLESVTVVGGTKEDIENGVTFEITEAASTLKVNFTNNLYKNSIKVLKIDQTTRGEDVQTPIKGAEFTLIRKGDDGFKENPGFFIKGTSNDNGLIEFNNLVDGDYRLEETAIPKGYSRTSDGKYIYFKIEGGVVTQQPDGGELPITVVNRTSDATAVVTYDDYQFIVGNTPAVALPSTGGMGTGLIYATGTGLLLLAVIAWVMKAKKRDYGAY